jgi:hypothetical protein
LRSQNVGISDDFFPITEEIKTYIRYLLYYLTAIPKSKVIVYTIAKAKEIKII